MGKPFTEQEKENPFVKQMLERAESDTGVNREAIRNECTAALGWVEFLRQLCGTDLELENALEIVRSRVQTVLDTLEKL